MLSNLPSATATIQTLYLAFNRNDNIFKSTELERHHRSLTVRLRSNVTIFFTFQFAFIETDHRLQTTDVHIDYSGPASGFGATSLFLRSLQALSHRRLVPVSFSRDFLVSPGDSSVFSHDHSTLGQPESRWSSQLCRLR